MTFSFPSDLRVLVDTVDNLPERWGPYVLRGVWYVLEPPKLSRRPGGQKTKKPQPSGQRLPTERKEN